MDFWVELIFGFNSDIFRCAQSIVYLTFQNYIVNRLNKEFSFST